MRINYRLFSVYCLTLVSAILCEVPMAIARDANPVIEYSAGVTKDKEQYQTKGIDPYFVLTLEKEGFTTTNDQSNTRHLVIPFDLTHSLTGRESIKAEVFFNPQPKIKASSNATKIEFEPFHRLQIEFTAEQSKGIKIPLESSLKIGDARSIRLDIDGCRSCRFSFSHGASLVSGELQDPLDKALPEVQINKIFNGLTTLSENGMRLNPSDWELHDATLIKSDPQFQFTPSGGDPYIRSPRINISTDHLAGVLFRLNVKYNQSRLHDFQLFYATEQHRFIESASAIFRVVDKQGRLEFFIPLDFLRSQFPAQFMLEQLRLDIASHSVRQSADALQDVQWQLDEVILVHHAQSAEFTPKTPDSLVQLKRQRANKSQLILGILKKVTADLGFLIFYFMGFILGILYLVRQFKRSKTL